MRANALIFFFPSSRRESASSVILSERCASRSERIGSKGSRAIRPTLQRWLGGWVAARRRDRGCVQDPAQPWPAALDLALAMQRAAVVVERRHARQRRDLAPVE